MPERGVIAQVNAGKAVMPSQALNRKLGVASKRPRGFMQDRTRTEIGDERDKVSLARKKQFEQWRWKLLAIGLVAVVAHRLQRKHHSNVVAALPAGLGVH